MCIYIYMIHTHLYTSTNNMCIYRLYEYTHGTPHKSLASLQSPSEACIWILISCWERVRRDKVSNISLHLAAHLQDIQTNLSWLPDFLSYASWSVNTYTHPFKGKIGRHDRAPTSAGTTQATRGSPLQGIPFQGTWNMIPMMLMLQSYLNVLCVC